MKTLLSLLLALLFVLPTFAQSTEELIEDQLIIQLKDQASPQLFVQQFKQHFNAPDLQVLKTVSKRYHLHVISFDPTLTDRSNLFHALERHQAILSVSNNRQAQLRSKTPDDTLFEDQWDMDLINAPEVWEFATGDSTALGDEIVIASLEPFDVGHEDIQDNIWLNKDEIPNNNLDDDDNGYIDDYVGVDFSFGQTDLPHGTSVSAIMGAKGDNGKGVSGVNWNTKLMMVVNDRRTGDIIEALEYIYDMRKKYNDTDGNAGAFVVALNTSFGFSDAFPEDEPGYQIWCDLYNDLGNIGVLSFGAVPNPESTNVDLVGDMPTTCTSEFFIAVTDTNQEDELEGAFGKTTVDIAAPGTGTFTAKVFDNYGTFNGTSAATPHVAASIGLLYSLPCEELAQAAKDDPEATAQLMRNFILNGSKKLDALEDKTTSGGRLDLAGSLDLIQGFCGNEKGPLKIVSLKPNPVRSGNNISVRFQTPEPDTYTARVYNSLGQLLYSYDLVIEGFIGLEHEINTTNYAAGIYFLSIESPNDINTHKFVVY